MHDLQLEKNSSLVNKHHKTEQKSPPPFPKKPPKQTKQQISSGHLKYKFKQKYIW